MAKKYKREQKNPSSSYSPHISKIPRIDSQAEPESVMKLSPAWQVSILEMVDPFGWHALDAVTIRTIHRKLAEFEGRTWADILVKEKSNNHTVEVSKICREARQRLEAINQADTDNLVSLRLSGKERIWGIQNGRVLKVLWWDPEHLVYPSPKKNT